MLALQIVAWCFLGLGVLIGVWQYTAIQHKEVALGRVTELAPKHDSDGTTYTVVAEFPDRAGQRHTYRANFSSSHPGYAVGDPIRIFFDRHNPAACGVLSFGYRFGVAWCLVVIGLALLLLSAGWRHGNRWLDARFPTTVRAPQGHLPPQHEP